MPLYEYECKKCDRIVEVTQKITEAALETCPECRSPDFKRIISRTAFALKGTGYYSTDYKKTSAKTSTEKKSEPSVSAQTNTCAPGGCGKSDCATS